MYSHINITWQPNIITIGIASAASSHNFNDIKAIDRNIFREASPNIFTRFLSISTHLAFKLRLLKIIAQNIAPTYEGRAIPSLLFKSPLKEIPIVIIIDSISICCSIELRFISLFSISIFIPTSSSLTTSLGFKSNFFIKCIARGDPKSPPATRPNVAAESATVNAPVTPNPSTVCPKAPADPCPPDIDTDPAKTPSNGLIPVALATPTPITVCIKVITPLKSQNIINNFPPFFNPSIEEPNPIVVKNTTMKGVCNVVSYVMLPIWTLLINRWMRANNNPPKTAAGIPNLSRNESLSFSFLPI